VRRSFSEGACGERLFATTAAIATNDPALFIASWVMTAPTPRGCSPTRGASSRATASMTARSVERSGAFFVVHFADRSKVTAKAVLIATGVVDELPPLEGIEQLFGGSVHVLPLL
jgi:hypothetical protein